MPLSGYKETVWKLQGRQKPRRCPCCGKRDSLRYIGFAMQYEPGLQAHLYQCAQCEMWVDCIWPKSMAQLVYRPRPIMLRQTYALAAG